MRVLLILACKFLIVNSFFAQNELKGVYSYFDSVTFARSEIVIDSLGMFKFFVKNDFELDYHIFGKGAVDYKSDKSFVLNFEKISDRSEYSLAECADVIGQKTQIRFNDLSEYSKDSSATVMYDVEIDGKRLFIRKEISRSGVILLSEQAKVLSLKIKKKNYHTIKIDISNLDGKCLDLRMFFIPYPEMVKARRYYSEVSLEGEILSLDTLLLGNKLKYIRSR